MFPSIYSVPLYVNKDMHDFELGSHLEEEQRKRSRNLLKILDKYSRKRNELEKFWTFCLSTAPLRSRQTDSNPFEGRESKDSGPGSVCACVCVCCISISLARIWRSGIQQVWKNMQRHSLEYVCVVSESLCALNSVSHTEERTILRPGVPLENPRHRMQTQPERTYVCIFSRTNLK